MGRILGRAAVAALLLLGVASLFAQGPRYGSIVGQIQVARALFPNRPVLVNLTTRGINAGMVYTDNEGRFGFYQLLGNPYRITIDDPDYAPVERLVDLDPSSGAVKIVNITLVPKREIEKPPSSGRDGVPGKNANAVAGNELARQIPDAAVDEFKAGVKAESSKKPKDALGHYLKAIEIAPDFYQARNNLGALYLARGEPAEAQRQFEAAIRSNPAEGSAYFNLANVFLLSKRPVEAADTARKGLRLEPDSDFGQFVFGSALGRLGERQQAESALRRALELNPHQVKAHLALVNLYLGSGQKQAAIAELKSFLNAAPGDALAPQAREVLQRLETETQAR